MELRTMSKKQGFFILAGVGIGLVSGLSPLTAKANVFTTDAKQDLKAAEKKLESAQTKLDKEVKGDKASTASVTTAFRTVPCKPDAITVKFNHGNGEFTGMSHDGAELTVMNTGSKTCSVPGRLDVDFLTHGKKPLPITVQNIKGFTPGPVVAPVVLAHGAKAKTNLRWVSCKVFDKNVCYKPHFVAVKIQGQEVRAPFKIRICGDKAKGGAVYETGYLHPVILKKAAAQPAKKCKA
ncbi:hypothetical protein RF55_15767 [Lasius niger]|uniref:DUF4232 domain-containing protein n=1 Tax=Lasius niger TaxID=67767 RepID=A0A0J7MYS9_LASNI|nr:hypothetical protein RF55_15767 [Lasius niger]